MKKMFNGKVKGIVGFALVAFVVLSCFIMFNFVFANSARVDADQTKTTIVAETFRGATQKIGDCQVEIKYVESDHVRYIISTTSKEAVKLNVSGYGDVTIEAGKKTDIKVAFSQEKNNTVLITGDTVIAKYTFGGWKNRGKMPHPEGIINGKSEVEIFNNSVISTPGFDATYMNMEKYNGYKVTIRLGNITEEINDISAVQYFTKDEETYSIVIEEADIERSNGVNTVDFTFSTEYFGTDYQHDLYVTINGRTIIVKNYAKV